MAQRPRTWLNRIVAPVLVVIASAGILSTSVWIHRMQATASNVLSNDIATSTSTPTNTIPAQDTQSIGIGPANSVAGTGSTSTLSPQTGHPLGTSKSNSVSVTPSSQSSVAHSNSSNPQHTHSEPATTQNSTKSNPGNRIVSQPTSPSDKDIGFAPVLGGTIQSLAKAPSSNRTAASTVIQYGPQPETTWSYPVVVGPQGQKFSLAQAMPPRNYVILPLQQGVLWALIPPTAFQSGQRGRSMRPTSLEYTPYPTRRESAANPPPVLTDKAKLLANIPVTTAVHTTSPWMGWYTTSVSSTSPVKHAAQGTSASSSTANETGNSPSNATINQTVTGTGPTTTTNASSNSTEPSSNPTNVDATKNGEALFLQGLYQTSNGAVITISVSSPASSKQIMWVYEWNEATQSLTPLTTLDNGAGTYSWLSVGPDVVYYGTRRMIPPADTKFEGTQTAVNIHTGQSYPIRLGTWTSAVVPEGDKLAFLWKQTLEWKQFTPNPNLVAATRSGS